MTVVEGDTTRLVLVGDLPAMMALATEMVHDSDGSISVGTADGGTLSEWCLSLSKVAVVDVKVNLSSLVRRLRGEMVADAKPAAAIAQLVGQSVDQVERALILQTLERCGGNRTAAASMLGISVRTMRNKLRVFLSEDVAAPAPLLRS